MPHPQCLRIHNVCLQIENISVAKSTIIYRQIGSAPLEHYVFASLVLTPRDLGSIIKVGAHGLRGTLARSLKVRLSALAWEGGRQFNETTKVLRDERVNIEPGGLGAGSTGIFET